MMKKNKRILIGVLAVVIVIFIVMFLKVTDGLTEGKKVTLNGIDLSVVSDGSYTGTYDFKRWSNTVTVHVEDHRIVDIEIIEDVMAEGATNCSDDIIMHVIEAQNTNIDTVSGATVTSKAYLKAIENALEY